MKNLATALVKFQGEVGSIPKDATNPFYKSKYATLESVINTIKPTLAKHGLAVAQLPDGKGLKTILMHESGESIEATMELVIKEQTPQSQGSSLTYARRYALSAILGLATDEDDDGNEATKPAAKPVAKPAGIKPPQSIADKREAVKARIEELCDTLALVPLVSDQEYADYVKANTDLDYKPENYMEIGKALRALVDKQ